MERTVEPEILDSLPPDDPAALRNRRDLRVTNLLMGNHAWLARTLRRLVRPGERVLELGAGTGELIQRLARHGIHLDGLDRWPRPPGLPATHVWHQADLLGFDGYGDYAVIVGNLILHQFDDTVLAALGAHFRGSAGLIIACEPVRRSSSQLLYRVVGPLFGAHRVSLHDAHVSIAAGFLGGELPRALGLAAPDWEVQSGAAPIGAYHLVAVRRT